MKKQTAEVLLRTGDTISGRSAAAPLGNPASVHTEKALLLESLAARQYVRQVEHTLLQANQKAAKLLDFVQDLALQKGLFTKREHEFFEAIIQHQLNKEIAQELHIPERTVKFRVGSLLRKLGKRIRHELILRNAVPRTMLCNQKAFEIDREAQEPPQKSVAPFLTRTHLRKATLGNGRRQLRIKLPKQLTTRQYAALVCLGEGLTHKEIQVKLNMTPYMVKNDVRKLIRKAGLRRGTDFGRKYTVGDFLGAL
jgi:DNA-binding NarL/FixJ family response regulator